MLNRIHVLSKCVSLLFKIPKQNHDNINISVVIIKKQKRNCSLISNLNPRKKCLISTPPHSLSLWGKKSSQWRQRWWGLRWWKKRKINVKHNIMYYGMTTALDGLLGDPEGLFTSDTSTFFLPYFFLGLCVCAILLAAHRVCGSSSRSHQNTIPYVGLTYMRKTITAFLPCFTLSSFPTLLVAFPSFYYL